MLSITGASIPNQCKAQPFYLKLGYESVSTFPFFIDHNGNKYNSSGVCIGGNGDFYADFPAHGQGGYDQPHTGYPGSVYGDIEYGLELFGGVAGQVLLDEKYSPYDFWYLPGPTAAGSLTGDFSYNVSGIIGVVPTTAGSALKTNDFIYAMERQVTGGLWSDNTLVAYNRWVMTIRDLTTAAVVARYSDSAETSSGTSLLSATTGVYSPYPAVATDLLGWAWVVRNTADAGTFNWTTNFPILVEGYRYNRAANTWETTSVTLTNPNNITLYRTGQSNQNPLLVTKVYQ